jgi:hypothetical protein
MTAKGISNGTYEQQGCDILSELQKCEIRQQDAGHILFQQGQERGNVLRENA